MSQFRCYLSEILQYDCLDHCNNNRVYSYIVNITNVQKLTGHYSSYSHLLNVVTIWLTNVSVCHSSEITNCLDRCHNNRFDLLKKHLGDSFFLWLTGQNSDLINIDTKWLTRHLAWVISLIFHENNFLDYCCHTRLWF